MDSVSLAGRMGANTKVSGATASSRDKENIRPRKAPRRQLIGRMGAVLAIPRKTTKQSLAEVCTIAHSEHFAKLVRCSPNGNIVVNDQPFCQSALVEQARVFMIGLDF
mmetsp:Transcript_37415/g.59233  ORF Transcript_37415/g.59233 Transcript_37415/m.59233 type:complete len:108 (+) Transcript_37415:40-363(+)